MSNILSRIQEITFNEGITIGALERKIGASKGVLSRAINNGTDIQSKWIGILVDNYPQYSTRWLLTGRGSMLRSNQEQPIPQMAAQPVVQQDLSLGEATSYIYKMYEKEKEENKSLLKQIGSLEERLRQLESSQSTSQDKRQSDEIALAFPSDSSGGSIQDSIHTRKPTAILGKSSAGKI